MKIFAIIIACLAQLSIFGQTKTFDYNYGLCSCSGKYDSKKVSHSQLSDTYLLCLSIASHDLMKTQIWNIEQMDSVSSKLANLKREYQSSLKRIKKYNLLPGEYWEDVRQSKIRSLKERYKLQQFATKGFRNPYILKKYIKNDSCFNYVDAIINGGEVMLNEWQKLIARHCGSSLNDCYEMNYTTKYDSPDKLDYAKLDLINFGWWNCVSRYLPSEPNDNQSVELNEFEKQFIKIVRGCSD